MINRSTVW